MPVKPRAILIITFVTCTLLKTFLKGLTLGTEISQRLAYEYKTAPAASAADGAKTAHSPSTAAKTAHNSAAADGAKTAQNPSTATHAESSKSIR